MLKQHVNTFRSKFRLLNSQENTEEISWSSSESSDFENISLNNRNNSLTNKHKCRKRKRKNKAPKNLSNLDVTILEIQKEPNEIIKPSLKQSPIMSSKRYNNPMATSPILQCSPQYFPPYKCTNRTSPIINTKKIPPKSPILTLKHASPKATMKFKKKLFTNMETKNMNNTQIGQTLSVSETEKSSDRFGIKSTILNQKHNDKMVVKITESPKVKLEEEITKELSHKEDNSLNSDINTSQDDSLSMQKTCKSVELKDQIKSFFNSHFNSQSPSQHSITETQTSKEDTKSCDDIEMTSSLTQVVKSNRTSFDSIKSEPVSKLVSPSDSFQTDFTVNTLKKIKYKKDGLAYRLNGLLKKQIAKVSLWQHEKYLAENSNFVIPKGEESVFHIRKVNFKYGCYLLETMDSNDVTFLIIINSNLSYCNFKVDSIFKLYQPYTVSDLNLTQKLITNACKFECISFL